MTPRATPPSEATVATGYLHALFDHLRGRGTDPLVLLPDARDALADRSARISEARAAGWFRCAAATLGDDALGLHVGERIRPGHYGVLGYMAMACTTLGEALARQQRYQTLVLSIPAANMQVDGEIVTCAWNPGTDASFRQLADFNFAALLTYMRWLTDQPLPPRAVEMTYPRPRDVREHARVFGCEPRFGSDAYRIAFPLQWLALPLVQADPALRALMDRAAESQLRSLDGGDAWTSRVRRMVESRLGHDAVALDAIASSLGVPARTLQRRLGDEGASFAALVDDVREARARELLGDAALDLTDVTFLLGFSEHSAFARAFKRWTGQSPQAFRGSR